MPPSHFIIHVCPFSSQKLAKSCKGLISATYKQTSEQHFLEDKQKKKRSIKRKTIDSLVIMVQRKYYYIFIVFQVYTCWDMVSRHSGKGSFKLKTWTFVSVVIFTVCTEVKLNQKCGLRLEAVERENSNLTISWYGVQKWKPVYHFGMQTQKKNITSHAPNPPSLLPPW